MGTYGIGIYACDTAEDVRDFCSEVYPLLGVEEGTKLLYKEFSEIIESEIVDNDYASFWYALADWQWKHGILSDSVKNKALELLSAHAGIEEWQEDGTASDVRKRIKVMDELYARISSPQPEVKLKKAVLKKPRHKVGDIVIIRACGTDYKYAEDVWSLKYGAFSDIYVSDVAEKVTDVLEPPFEAYNKYIALLCVGEEKKPHSIYIDGFYDCFSVYAVYDYVSDEKPDVNTLRACGFLPTYVRYSDPETNRIMGCRWDYKTTLDYESFKAGYISSVEKLFSMEEAERFECAISKNDRSTDIVLCIDLNDMFCNFYYESERLSRAGIQFDDLSSDFISESILLMPEDVEKRIKDEMRESL